MSREQGSSPVLASMIVDEEVTDGTRIAVEAANIAAAGADMDGIAPAGFGHLLVHR